MQDKTGQRVPEITFITRKDGDWLKLSTQALFSGRKVVVFSLPGAYTPTCSSSHLPRYEALTPLFKEHGVDEVVCLSVNDGFVMEAWAKDQKLENVSVVADGNGDFSRGMGALVDKSDLGFGHRSWRYSMFVDDGVIQQMFIEPQRPGDPFEVSDADTMLQALFPEAKEPASVTILSKPGCSYCARAKALLSEHGMGYEEILLGSGLSFKTLRNLSGGDTAPQLWIDGEHVSGLDGLRAWFAAR